MRKNSDTTYTFRLPSELKAQAEAAAQNCDVTLAQVLRRALRALVSHERQRAGHVGPGSIPEAFYSADRAVPRARIQAAQDEQRQRDAARLVQLERKAARNETNRQERQELAELREKLRRDCLA